MLQKRVLPRILLNDSLATAGATTSAQVNSNSNGGDRPLQLHWAMDN